MKANIFPLPGNDIEFNVKFPLEKWVLTGFLLALTSYRLKSSTVMKAKKRRNNKC
jgi:hypothetical protein